jgi:hypothetical protein
MAGASPRACHEHSQELTMSLLRRLGPRGSTFSERVLRTMLFVLLIFGISYLFWHNHERRLDRVTHGQAVLDRTGELAPERLREAREFSRRMRDHFGITVEVRIAQRELLAPPPDGKTLFIGLVPSRREAVILLPPLVERALDQDFVAHLVEEHFEPYWDVEGGWQEGLQQAMALLWEQMRGLERSDG